MTTPGLGLIAPGTAIPETQFPGATGMELYNQDVSQYGANSPQAQAALQSMIGGSGMTASGPQQTGPPLPPGFVDSTNANSDNTSATQSNTMQLANMNQLLSSYQTQFPGAPSPGFQVPNISNSQTSSVYNNNNNYNLQGSNWYGPQSAGTPGQQQAMSQYMLSYGQTAMSGGQSLNSGT
jgi:hypothetical protein